MTDIDPIAFTNAERALTSTGSSLKALAASADELVKLAHPKSLTVSNVDRRRLFQYLSRVSNRLAEEDARANAASGVRPHATRVAITEFVAFQIAPQDKPGDRLYILKRLLNDLEMVGSSKHTQTIATLLADNPSIHQQERDRADALLQSWGMERPVVAKPESRSKPRVESSPARQHVYRREHRNGDETPHLLRHEVRGFLQDLADLENLFEQQLQQALERSPHYDLYQRATRLAELLEDIPALFQAANEITERLVAREMEPIWGMLDVANALASKGDNSLDGVRLYTAIAWRTSDPHEEFRGALGMLLNADRLQPDNRKMVLQVLADDCPFEGTRQEARDMLQGTVRPRASSLRRDI